MMSILPDAFPPTPSQPEPTKVCTACKRLLLWSAYTIQRPANVPISKCKVCTAAAKRAKTKAARDELPPEPIPDPDTLKTCTKCGETKPPDHFHVKDKRTGRRYSWCKACHAAMNRANEAKYPGRVAEYGRKYYAADPEKHREAVRNYRLRNPEKVADAERRYLGSEAGKATKAAYREATKEQRKASTTRYLAENADKIKAKAAAYREANRDVIAARHRKWIEDNPEAWAVICARAKHRRRDRESKAECTLTADEWAEILRLQANRCARCRRKFTPFLKPHKDHVIPLSKGGGLTFANVQALCGRCNNGKFVGDTDYRGLLPGLLD